MINIHVIEAITYENNPYSGLEAWAGGSLWDLVESVSQINRTAALAILKNRGLLNEQ